MENELARLDRFITRFMLDTCQCTTCDYAFNACLCRFLCRSTSMDLIGDVEAISSGSTVEFYITPLLPCVGDIDIMSPFNIFVSVPAGHTPPTELPAQYWPTVNVFEIIDSHQPGYVYLKSSYVLRQSADGRYAATKLARDDSASEYLPRSRFVSEMLRNTRAGNSGQSIYDISRNFVHHMVSQKHHAGLFYLPKTFFPHGPAATTEMQGIAKAIMDHVSRNTLGHQVAISSVDIVTCTHCHVWPPQAAYWSERPRAHGWPDTATILLIVSSGCDVVSAVHPNCRQDAWMNEYQWRLSFSRAEVTLLNSWTPVQQIVFHMLRFVLKNGIVSKTDDKEPDLPKLCNYHMKTLMLWECEQKSPTWWSAESNSLVKLCSSLLYKLSAWVEDRHCRHYFIGNCNVLDHFDNDDASVLICDSLRTFAGESFLVDWFVKNYICKCVEMCPADLSVLYKDVRSADQLEFAAQMVVDWKLGTWFSLECSRAEQKILDVLDKFHMDAKRTSILVDELQSVNLCLRDYCVAVSSLLVACKLSVQPLTEDLLEVLWTLFNPCTSGVRDTSRSASAGLSSVEKAIKLATLSSVRSNSLEMLHNEMAKAYLKHSVTFGQETRCAMAHILLAILCYKSDSYETSTRHCKHVLNQIRREPVGFRSIAAASLPHVDENVEAVIGLIILYQHVMTKALNRNVQMLPTSDLAFTVELLARYLLTQCSAAIGASGRGIEYCRQHLFQSRDLLLGDVLLFRFAESDTGMLVAAVESGDLNTDAGSFLVTTLELVSLEKLISVRQVTIREMHSPRFPIINEFEALLAFKCGLFEECLEMCRNNVNVLFRSESPLWHMYEAFYPAMISLLDAELGSLFALARFLYVKCPKAPYSTLDYKMFSLLTLSTHLLAECQKKLHSDSICDTLRFVRSLHDLVFPPDATKRSDRLVLKLTYRSLKLHIADCKTCANQHYTRHTH